jgi:hypothetical protein
MSPSKPADTPPVSYRALERATVDPVPAVDPPLPAPLERRATGADRRGVMVVVAALALLTALSWRRWGYPTFDPGLDLSVADMVAHGAVPYRDARYFYGPAGLYSLAFAFKLFGTSLTTAFAFGYVQTIAILASFYALARTYLRAAAATLATLLVLAIAFNGSFFDFVLPHTNSGTFGCLFLVLMVLAITRGRLVAAGVAGGVLLLTRPEFAMFAAATGAGAVLGRGREAGVRPAARAAVAIAAPALAVAAAVYVPLASAAGAHEIFFEDLIPLDFARAVGNKLQGEWAPFDLTSFVALGARGLVYGSLLGAAVLAAVRWRRSKLAALAPLAGAVGLLLALDAAARVLGAFPGTRATVEDECTRLVIAMSVLPVPAILAGVWGAWRALRNRSAPFLTWTADLALLFGAAAAAGRAYNRFTVDSYAPYYAALPVLVAAILHQRIADRWPRARMVALGALGAMAAALALNAYAGHYRDDTTLIRTPRGAYMGFTPAAPATQRTIDFLAAHTRPGEPMLSVPDDPGFHFLANLRPALRELTFVPGTLDTAADERVAIARLQKVRPRFVVVGAKTFDQYGYPKFGRDYNQVLGRYLSLRYRRVAAFGDVSHPQRNAFPAQAYTVLLRRGASLAP